MSNEEHTHRCTGFQPCGRELVPLNRRCNWKEQYRSGHLPSDAEAASLAAIVNAADLDLLLYDAHITRLTENLKALESQRADLQLYRDGNQALLSPIRKLPKELLVEIFSFVCGSQYGLKITQLSVQTSALDLSQVCSLWREVVCSTTSLWCNFFVDLSTKTELVMLLDMYVQRSKENQSPWTLAVVCTMPSREKEDPDYESDTLEYTEEWDELDDDGGWLLLAILVERASQWRDVTIKASFSMLEGFEDCVIQWPGEFPLLETLRLHWTLPGAQDAQRSPAADLLRNLGKAPQLRTLALPEFQQFFEFPYEQLTSVSILVELEYEDMLHMLRACPNIQHLTIPTLFTRDVSFELPLNLRACNLASLALLSSQQSDLVVALLNSLTVSKLTQLELGTGLGGRVFAKMEAWEEIIANLIRRSACPLQELTLSSGSFQSEEALLSLCQAVPTLAQLCIAVTSRSSSETPYTLTSAFFEALTVPAGLGHHPVLSQLTHLTVRVEETSPLVFRLKPLASLEAIIVMAESRCRSALNASHSPVTPLKNLHLRCQPVMATCWEGEQKHLEPRIHALKEAGMDVSLAFSQDFVLGRGLRAA